MSDRMNVRRLMVARNNYAGTMMRFQIFDKWIKKVCPCGRGDVLGWACMKKVRQCTSTRLDLARPHP